MIRLLRHRWTRVGVSAGVIAGLLTFIPIQALLAAAGQVPPAVMASAVFVLIAGHVVAALKWRLSFGAGNDLSLRETLQAHFAGVLANLWLPGVIGGDLVRAGIVLRRSDHRAGIALASLVDRVVDSAALMCLSLAGLCVMGARSQSTRQVFVAVAGAGILGLAALSGAYWYLKSRRGSPGIDSLLDATHLIGQQPTLLLAAFGMSICVQVAFVLVNAQLGRVMGMTAPIAAWFLAWPLAKLVALVPISAAGFGVREAALVVLMRSFGDPASAVMAAGLLWQGVFVTGGFLGWAVLRVIPGATPEVDRRPLSSRGERVASRS